uniref:Large ribosomal subunit protein mL42 n=1 Tax=Marmota marmota marmota TaxID=9994 RepID=A0A8C5ZEV3_MARMA
MAHGGASRWAIPKRTIWKHLFPVPNGALSGICHQSTYSFLPGDYNCKVELTLTSDGNTQPVPQLDPVHGGEETRDQVLTTRLEEKGEDLEQGPGTEELSKMFFTTEHCWCLHGQYILLFKVSPTSLRSRIHQKKDDTEIHGRIKEKCYPVSHLPFEKMQPGVITNV